MGIELDTDIFASRSPAGHFLALRIGFAFPLFEQNALPKDWIARYSSRGLVLADPVMNWLYQNTGATRWSEITLEDPRNVMGQARRFGLNYGVAICCCDKGLSGQRSFGSFARSDREFLDVEVTEIAEELRRQHEAMVPPSNLTRAELEALGMVKNGLLMKEIADVLGVTEGAVKQRLKNAKSKLKAKTSTHAATMATSFGLI
ncbi:MAG: LuxR family transcriptional regulator [Rhodobacteraceae bacterium]|nr:LuxR family transcriptional regulator [Paracoccaceae bacterium]